MLTLFFEEKVYLCFKHLLQACQFFIQEMNDNRTEHKTWENCEEASNTWNDKTQTEKKIILYYKNNT